MKVVSAHVHFRYTFKVKGWHYDLSYNLVLHVARSLTKMTYKLDPTLKCFYGEGTLPVYQIVGLFSGYGHPLTVSSLSYHQLGHRA